MRVHFVFATSIALAMAGLVATTASAPWSRAGAAATCAAPARAGLAVAWRNGRLAVRADAVPLARVLAEIGKASGAEVVLHGDLGGPVSGCLEGLPVGRALQRLAPRAGVVAVQDGTGAGARLIKLVVHGPPPAGDAQPPGGDVDGETPAARLRAVQALARGDAPGAAETLKRVLAGDPDGRVRAQAARALASAGDSRDAAALLAAVADPDKTVRTQSVRALGRIGGTPAVHALTDVLLHEDDQGVRTTAAWSLARIGGKAVESALRRAGQASDPAVRKVARQALGQWRAALEDAGQAP